MSIRDYRRPSRTPWWAKPWLILVILPVLAFLIAFAGVFSAALNRK